MFVPTNEAVKEVIDSNMSQDELEKVVKFHIAKDQDGNSISTWLDGQNLTFSAEKNVSFHFIEITKTYFGNFYQSNQSVLKVGNVNF